MLRCIRKDNLMRVSMMRKLHEVRATRRATGGVNYVYQRALQ